VDRASSFPYYPAETGFNFEDRPKSYSFNGPSEGDDPEMKRKKRVASYNKYAVEGRLVSSLRNSFKWIKGKFADKKF
ncbi:hypothetical protein M569_03627, partial [Genlisea aurea]